jgi:hypothetical protein
LVNACSNNRSSVARIAIKAVIYEEIDRVVLSEGRTSKYEGNACKDFGETHIRELKWEVIQSKFPSYACPSVIYLV